MMQTLIIATPPGGNIARDPRLIYIRPLLVALEGTAYDIRRTGLIDITLRQVSYNAQQGNLRFATDVQFLPGDTVYVIYRL